MTVCKVCFRHCDIKEGLTGACGARTCKDGKVIAANYGRVTALALDPIEKKPLSRFMPGSKILSYGSYGCNLFCPFCQNYDISRSKGEEFVETITPEELAYLADKYKDKGNIGVAYTYNEPLVSYEFVRDTAKLVKKMGMKNVLVTNGTVSPEIEEEILPYIDAMNIDLKGFSEDYYTKLLKGDRKQVLDFIAEASKHCHIELTTLIIPDENDSVEQMRQLSAWIASLDKKIPLHVSRFFPCFHMMDKDPTPIKKVYELADVAREKLEYVYTGNC